MELLQNHPRTDLGIVESLRVDDFKLIGLVVRADPQRGHPRTMLASLQGLFVGVGIDKAAQLDPEGRLGRLRLFIGPYAALLG